MTSPQPRMTGPDELRTALERVREAVEDALAILGPSRLPTASTFRAAYSVTREEMPGLRRLAGILGGIADEDVRRTVLDAILCAAEDDLHEPSAPRPPGSGR